MSSFHIEVAAAEHATVVRVAGDVDLQTSPQFWEVLEQAIDAATNLQVDLRGIEYIDSSGVAVLIQGLKHAGRKSVPFSLLEPSLRALAVLDLSQLTQIFRIDRDPDQTSAP